LEHSTIEAEIINWLELHKQYALILIPLFAFAEACIGIGLFVSGVFLVSIASWVYGSDYANLSQILALAFCGAMLGDHVGFYAGFIAGPRLHELNLIKKRQHILHRAEQLILKYGFLTVFIGRLIPAIRSLIPALLGISGFNRLQYTLLDLAACTVWIGGLGLIIIGIDNFI